MVETTFTVRFVTDNKEEGKEILDEIKRLIKDSYVSYDISDIEQDYV